MSDDRPKSGGPDGRGNGTVVVVAIVAFATALAALAYFGHPVARLKPATVVVEPLIAVLPFHNLEGDETLEVVASNVTLSVIRALEELPGVRVVPYAAVLDRRELEAGVESVARELSADFALVGSVERVGAKTRVEAYLVQPGERPRIWADELFFDEPDAEQVPARVADLVRHAFTGIGAPPADRPGSPSEPE